MGAQCNNGNGCTVAILNLKNRTIITPRRQTDRAWNKNKLLNSIPKGFILTRYILSPAIFPVKQHY